MSSGIYLITCTANGDRYIGSSKNITRRWCDHRAMLRVNKAHNAHMQHAWNKYGQALFTFEVLEQVDDLSTLIEREQYWIDLLKPEFNKAKQADDGFLGQTHSLETRTRLSEIQRLRMQSPTRRQLLRDAATEQNRTKGNGSKGKPVPETRRQKLREATQRQFATPESRQQHSEITRASITPEAREKNRQAKLGKKQSPEVIEIRRMALTRAWANHTPEERAARIAATGAATAAAKAKQYTGFVAPDGTEYRDVHNLSAFCREHGLLNSKMGQVATGKRKHHKGWRRIEP